ncbi:YIP1 family protein [Edaphobacter albus]|uniref:YIP1 family protein n=1 Tax=Edaphobacter sp. 4G125 TaxID=2763071 RepID=UPI0016467881|nr:YIP1 family protein [Edaphobacter sp. 4G125]QNI36832.1 YIP1 family protein [Edaphobacter sp. 4G125]
MTVETVAGSQDAGLSEVERVVDVFVAPSKTFTDILRNASWWLPFILMLLITVGATFAVDKQVGFVRVAENQIHQSPKQEDRFNNLAPEQKAAQLLRMEKGYRYTSYYSFVFILIFVAAAALLYWVSFNFGLGAQTTYGQMFAVWMYASLPKLISGLLAIVLLMAGVNIDSYNMQNPVGTNLAYYVPDAAPWLRSLLSFFDVIGLWVLALLVIGTAIVAKVSRGKAAAVVVGWWLFGLIVMTGIAAATS